jgi:hypothetical protein
VLDKKFGAPTITNDLQVVAARLRARSIGQQRVRGGVDLAGDEHEGLLGD